MTGLSNLKPERVIRIEYDVSAHQEFDGRSPSYISLRPELSDFYNKTSRTGVSPVLRGEMLGQPGRLSYRGLGILESKNRSV